VTLVVRQLNGSSFTGLALAVLLTCGRLVRGVAVMVHSSSAIGQVRMMAVALIACASAVAGVGGAASMQGRTDTGTLVFVGTYTGPKSEGIYAFRFDSAAGRLTPAGLAAATRSPSFLAWHPGGQWLYAVNEVDEFEGEKSGAVSAFAVDAASGRLTLLNQQSSRGRGPCHLSIDGTGTKLLVANYGGGTVAVLPIGSDGRLAPASSVVRHTGSGANEKRQQGPHAHAITAAPDNRFVLAADLGIDKLLVYRFDAARGMLAPNDPPGAAVAPGAGPRHFAFDPGGRRVYAINELSSTITTFDWEGSRGSLTRRESVSTLPAGHQSESWTAEVEVHPSGRFLYGSNRGHDSLAIFAVDQAGGALTLVGHEPTGGSWPRHFTITPDGQWLVAANQRSDSLVVFRIDQTSGRLTRTGDAVSVGSPACVLFPPRSR
jgi:6-phosphogluconolactonase